MTDQRRDPGCKITIVDTTDNDYSGTAPPSSQEFHNGDASTSSWFLGTNEGLRCFILRATTSSTARCDC